MTKNELGKMGIYWPKEPHPLTSEPFVHCELFEKRIEVNEMNYLPPSIPTREIYDYCEYTGEPFYVRDRTNAEYNQAMDAYKKATKKWEDSGGIVKVPAGQIIKGRFVTENGDWAEGTFLSEGKWSWGHLGIKDQRIL